MTTTTASGPRRTGARRCEVCGLNLEGRDPRAKVCSHACEVAKLRGRKRGALRSERRCFYCGEGFVPRRSDAVCCDECRASEPWRRAAPHETCEGIDADGFVSWLERMAPDYRARLNGQTRTVQRWAAGKTKPNVWTADGVLRALGLEAADVPARLWSDRPRIEPPRATCRECGEWLATEADMCGFCLKEARDDEEPAVAA